MQIEWKNKNRPIYYPSVCLIASNFTIDQGNLKFKGIHLPSTPLIKYLSYLFLFFPPSKLRSKYIFITSTRIVIEGTKETQLLIESSFIVFFSRLWAAQRSRARVQNIVFSWPLDETTIYQSTSSRFHARTRCAVK